MDCNISFFKAGTYQQDSGGRNRIVQSAVHKAQGTRAYLSSLVDQVLINGINAKSQQLTRQVSLLCNTLETIGLH
jgi:hypothetical protein